MMLEKGAKPAPVPIKKAVRLLTGSVGGFSDNDLVYLYSINCVGAKVGSRILKTETTELLTELDWHKAVSQNYPRHCFYIPAIIGIIIAAPIPKTKSTIIRRTTIPANFQNDF